jgi:hypothetical protein
MPPVSQKQRALFRWAEENPEAAAKRGIKPGVAKEFNESDPGGHLPKQVPYSKLRKRQE